MRYTEYLKLVEEAKEDHARFLDVHDRTLSDRDKSIILAVAELDIRALLSFYKNIEFFRIFKIKLRTVENWRGEKNTPPEHDIYFLGYAMMNE